MDKTKNKNTLLRFVSGLLIPTILFTQLATAPIANAQFGFGSDENEPTKVTSIVAVLVEDGLIEDNQQYNGLIGQYAGELSSLTLRDRISRFAKDVQLADTFTKSIILRVDENQTPYDISRTLETLYFQGDTSESEKSQLEGVITVGDVPLPVVNKNGYKFISMLPYTDFEEKAYIYNIDSRDFEYNSESLSPKAEVWHGVINPSREGQDGKTQLAEYLDKNHLYHSGHPDFTDFDEKVLYADTIWEQNLLDQTVLKRYENYASHLEDFAYHRYTKDLLNELLDGDEDLDDFVDPEMFEELPDVHSKTIIESYAVKFHQLFENYLQKANDLIDGTGRWEDWDSIVELISTKDLYTQEYLREVNDRIEAKVDEVVETLHAPVSFIEDVTVTGMITLDNDNNINIIQQQFINNNKHLEGGFNTIHFYGKAGIEITDAKECTLYRGNTEFNRVYNPDATDATGYGGCDASNIEHPERCFPDLAVDPVFDPNFGVPAPDVPKEALTYAGCFDFREKTRFDDYLLEATNYLAQLANPFLSEAQKDALPLPGSKYRPAEEIILFNSPLLTFKDILDMYGGFDGLDNDEDGQIDEQDEYNLEYKIDAENPYEIGMKILGNKQNQFILEDPPFEGIKKVRLEISRVFTPTLHTIDSITYHKEPTLVTIQKHLEEGDILSMPVNDPRFVAFQDQDGGYQEVIYPNTFRKASMDDYVAELEELEDYLMNLPGYDPTIVEIDGKLIELVQDEEEKVADAIDWLNFTIDQKHAYSIKNYLDRDADAYIGETTGGYEYFYLTAQGDSNNIEFALNTDPDINETDPEWNDPEAQLDPGLAAENAAEEEAEEEENSGRNILEWFVYIVQYLTEVGDSVDNVSFQAACGEFAVEDAALEEALKDKNDNGIPDGAEASVSLNVEFDNEDNLLITGSTEKYEIKVSAINVAGDINIYDSFTEVQLDLGDLEEARAQIDGPETLNLVNGEAIFYIRATEVDGSFNVSAESVNRPDTLTSNILTLRSEARKIRVYTYELQTVEPPTFTEEILESYVVKNENGETIAEIDPDTGKITILDSKYDIEVFESEPDKQMRIGIVEVRTGNLIAAVIVVPDEESVTLQNQGFSFEENALTLEGVHVKDINQNDYVIPYELNNSIYLLDNSGPYTQRIARITNEGQVYVADEHFIVVKNGDIVDEPYIFIIEDGSGNDLAEFYISYRQSEINVTSDFPDLLSKFIEKFGRTAFAQSTREDDSDQDGLTDLQEVFIGTNRIDKDTDNDGFEDGEEILSGYDPLKKDLRLFSDLDPIQPAYDAFAQLLLKGIITRGDNNTIRPNDLITREEYVRMVLGITCVNCSKFADSAKEKVDSVYSASPFPDSDISDEFGYCVKEAKNEGIVIGYAAGEDAGYFKPQYNISRAEAVKVILEAAGVDSLEYYEQGKPWYYRYVLKAQSENIFPEQTNPNLSPFNNYSESEFKAWVDNELASPSNVFENYITSAVTRAEFALMVRNITLVFDCYKLDQDGDGLPDNIEIYQYNTSTTLADTDQGGLDDLTEIITGKDPLNPEDDSFLDSDGDGIPDIWEDENGLDKFDPADAYYDFDSDGLINLNEYLNETDPRDNDTDDGGTQDGDEVWLQDTNPLAGGDDLGNPAFGVGIIALGNNIEQDTVFQIITEGIEEQVINLIDTFTADGLSTLFLAAEILDENGDVIESDNESVIEFFIEDTSTTDAELGESKVRVENGVAVNTITSTTKTGLIDIGAKLVTGSLPAEPHEVFAEPQDPVRMEIIPRSNVIKTGGLSKTPLTINIYDINDNLVNNNFFDIDVEVSGPGVLDIQADLDREKDGIQLDTYEGTVSVDLVSTELEGAIEINATLNKEDINLFATANVESRDDIMLEIVPDKQYVYANGEDIIQLRAKAVDGVGQILNGFNEEVIFKTVDESIGGFTTDPVKTLQNGQAVIRFKSTTKSGIAEIDATATGLEAGKLQFYSVAYQPFEIKLETESETFNSDGSESAIVTAKIYDMFGNFVEFDNQTQINFRITDATTKYGRINSSSSAIVSNGQAQISIAGNGISGEIHLVASSTGLQSGTLNLYPLIKITSEDIVGDYPDALYGTMLGGAFGDTTEEMYTAGEVLFKGNVQAVTALTVDANPKMPLATISATGNTSFTGDSSFESTFNPPNKVVISDPETDIQVAEVTYEYPGGMPINIVDFANTDILQEGVYLITQTEDEIFDFVELSNSAGITVNGNEALRIASNGKLTVSDNLLELEVSDVESSFLVLDVLYADEKIAEIIYAKNLNTDVKISGAITTQGIYVKKLSDEYIITSTVSGSSTKEPKGVLISDKELTVVGSSAPGFSYTSLEKINDVMGVGFDGDNKHSLFFAGGNSVGVSNIPYATDIGINLGDPTVRLGIQNQMSSSGYTKDIGQPLYFGDDTIKEMVLSDYNNDTLDDIIIAYESGEVRLLQRQLSARPYKDKGMLLDITNGIYSIASADFNNDGYDDLLVATKDPCVGDEVCFYLYENNEGNFERTLLNLDLEDRVSSIKIGDLNNDDFVDIVLAELSGNIKIYYNNQGVIETEGQILENLGMRIDSTSDFKTEVLIAYDGMPVELEYLVDSNGQYILDNNGDKIQYLDDDFNFENLTIDSGSASNNEFVDSAVQAQAEALGVDASVFASPEEIPFIYMDADPVFGNVDSSKKAVDINGSTLAMDDKIVYTITLFNNSPNDITNLMVSDFLTDTLEFNKESLECLNCIQEPEIIETGMTLRPWVVKIPSIPSGESRLITYEMNVIDIPEIALDLNVNFDANFPKDGFLDISANPKNNNSGTSLFLYSVSKDSETGRMSYARYVTDPAQPTDPDLPFGIKDTDEDGEADSLPTEIEDLAEDLVEGDEDGDGLPNSWDDINGEIENAANEINSIVDTFSCNGGCLPIPINNAFLAPGPINVMGTPVGVDPGTPVFTYGPVTIYLSPTLTASLANSVCVAGQCWSVIIPLLPPEACEAINEAFEDAMSRAGNVTSSAGGTSLLSGSGGSSGSLNPREGNGGLTGSSLLGSYKPSGSSKTNKKVPGFPGVITDWFAKQMEEIVVKLSDLPDLYVYYPNPSSFVSETPPTADFKTFQDVLTYVNKLPLVDLEVKSIQMKIPALSATEIPKLQAELQNLLAKTKLQLQQLKLQLKIPCELKPELNNKCLSAFSALEKPIASVEKNLKLLEEYKKLPRKILEWRTAKTKYIKQIICYLDTIVTYMGGYFKKQVSKINGWGKVALNVKATLKTWQKISKLMSDYQKSCDNCKTERYSLIQLLAQIFTGALPQPPVVQFPKWPDFHFDFSQIQLGLKVILPDLQFKKEQIIMPKIPELELPEFPTLPQLPTQPNVALPDDVEEILKEYEAKLNEIVNISKTFTVAIPELPEIPQFPELPDLPPMPMPQLPDLPDPPKIPELSVNIDSALDGLSVGIKIMCLLKKNLLPIPISNLKSHIEAATARSSSTALPIDTLFSFQSPQINTPSVDKIKLNLKVDLRLETESIYNAIEEVAQAWNSIVTDLSLASSQLSQAISEIEIPEAEIPEIPETPQIPEVQASNPDPIKLIATQDYISPDNLNYTFDEIKQNIENEDLPIEVENSYFTTLRNALISYTDSDQIYTNQIGENYNRLVALSDKAPKLDDYIESRQVASNKPIQFTNKQTNLTAESFEGIKELGRLIALNTNAISGNVIDEDEATSSSGQTELQGLYVYNPATGINERILMYEGEISLPHSSIIADIDEDEDEDIIYAYGGNVYLKENYLRPPSSKYVQYNSQNAKLVDLDEYIPEAPSVNNYDITYDSGTEGDFGWGGLNEGSISGYEIVNKDSLSDFDSTEYTPSDKIVVIEDVEQIITVGRIKQDFEITAVEGSYTVNGETTSLYNFGDSIETGSDSNTEIVISFSDSSQIFLGPDTIIQLPDYTPGDFEVTVVTGRAEFTSNFFTNLFLQENSSTINEEANVNMTFKNGDTVEILNNSYFHGSTVTDGLAHISQLNGQATIKGMSRQTFNSGSGKQKIKQGQVIHTMADSILVIYPEEGSSQNLDISENRVIPISQKYTDDIEMQVISGRVEIITPSDELDNQTQAEAGMLVQFNEMIEMQSGTMEITFANGAKIELGAEDTLQIFELTNPENPFINIETEEGNYYSQIYAIGNNGKTGNPTEVNLFAPQICSDDQKPFVEAGPSQKQVIVMQTLRLDASKSFDTNGDIVEFYIDTDIDEDADDDGDPANDKNFTNSIPSHPIFLVGPFEELGTVNFALNAVDESQNVGKQILEIEVIAPDITLNESSALSEIITGSIDPVAEEIPITIVRERDGIAKNLASTLTDENGEFRVDGLNYDDAILVRNVDGDIVAEIDIYSGRIIILDEDYYVDVYEAIFPSMPTRMVVIEKSTNEIMTTVLLIPDLNTDATIHDSEFEFDISSVVEFEGTHIKDTNPNDQFGITGLPGDDPNFTGGAEIRDQVSDMRISIVDSGGNIYFFDENLDLRVKAANDPAEPLVIEMLYGIDVVAEVYIAINNGKQAEIVSREEIGLPEEVGTSDIDGDGMTDNFELQYGFDARNPDDANFDADGDGLSNLEEFKLGTNPLNPDTDGDGFSDGDEVAWGNNPNESAGSPFDDVPEDHPYYDSILNLSQKDILRGDIVDGQFEFNPDKFIARKDFADIILKMLCIIPRPQAYEEPNLYSDMPFDETNYYYPVVKEATLQGFVTGYVGEIDEELSLNPYKPEATITQAEAVKIVLEALESQGIITLSDIQPAQDQPWYIPYISVAVDLSPRLIKESEVKETFILTPTEAQQPNKLLTRAEFAAIADRVLQAFDCYIIDTDGDGIPNIWELQNGLDPFDPDDSGLDYDEDQLSNLDEYRFGTNPFDPDTDDGGTIDGIEFDRGTNPVDFPEDDPFITTGRIEDEGVDPRQNLEEGVYIVERECNSCPCISALDHKADLILGDILFAVIANGDLSTIFSKSNELIFKYEPEI